MESASIKDFEAACFADSEVTTEDDDDDALSFTDLPERENLQEPPERETPFMRPFKSISHDFEFSRSDSASMPDQIPPEIFPADELFFKGRLLPLAGSLLSHYQEDSKGLRHAPKELYVQYSMPREDSTSYSRTTSRDSEWSRSSSSSTSQGSRRNSPRKLGSTNLRPGENRVNAYVDSRCDDSAATWKSEAMSMPAPVPAEKPRGTSLSNFGFKWQYFTRGLLNTPDMKLDDIRLRQGSFSSKSRVTGIRNSSQKPRIQFPEGKTKSVKESEEVPSGKKREESKGWRILSSIISFRALCRGSGGVVAGAHGSKVHDGNPVTFYSSELAVTSFVKVGGNGKGHGKAQTKAVPSGRRSAAMSLCKNCDATEPSPIHK